MESDVIGTISLDEPVAADAVQRKSYSYRARLTYDHSPLED